MCFGLLQEIAVAQKTLPQRSPGGKPVAGSFDIETPLFCGRFKFATESGNILHTEVSKGTAKSAYLRFRVDIIHIPICSLRFSSVSKRMPTIVWWLQFKFWWKNFPPFPAGWVSQKLPCSCSCILFVFLPQGLQQCRTCRHQPEGEQSQPCLQCIHPRIGPDFGQRDTK